MPRYKKQHKEDYKGIRKQLLDWLKEKRISFERFIHCCNQTKLEKEYWYDDIFLEVHYSQWKKMKLV